MNISDVIHDIKLTNGLNTIALPYKKPVEIVIQEIIQTSVRTFSQFKPQIKEAYEAIKDLRYATETEKRLGIFFLPEQLCTTPVQYADAYSVSSDGKSGSNNSVFTVGSPFIGFGAYYPQDIINSQMTGAAINKYAALTSKPATSKWLGYNKIRLFDFPRNGHVRFVVKCDHELNCETIPESCRESFIQLATLDVQRTLYAQLKNMNNVGSAFKEIQLKIDDWSGAEQARKELIQLWTETFHLDQIEELVQFF